MSLKDHKGIHAKKFHCNLCLYNAKSQADLNEHKKVGHTVELNCGMCNFTTGTKEDLSEHEKDFHKILNYKCKNCKKDFKFSSELDASQTQKWTSNISKKKNLFISREKEEWLLQILEPFHMYF